MEKRREALPPQPYFHNPPPSPSLNYNYILLPPYNPPRPSFLSRLSSFSLTVLLPILLLSAAVFLFWPSDPDLQLARLRLDHISFSPKRSSSSSVIPAVAIAIDVALDLTLRVRNKDFYSLDYRSLNVSIGYRGRDLGFVTSTGGRIRARGSSYVDATLRLDGVEILHDVLYLLEDMARGLIPFDTVSEIDGKLGLLFISFPIKANGVQ
ncbi:hypothetical protein ACLOJK_035546 [Asimina triloba]